MTFREERLAKNEAVFREVNERIREVTRPPGDAEFLCECGDSECALPVAMSLAEYEEIRANPRRFLVLPGHEVEDVETVIDRRESYTVVEKKHGTPADIVTAVDPRT